MADYTLLPDAFRIDPTAYIAPNASLLGQVTMGPESSVWFGVVVRADLAPIMIGRETNIQDNSVLHVDAGKPVVLGDQVTVGHRAIVHGATVHDRSLIGMGSIILNGAVIGSESIIGAGAIVTERAVIPPRSLVLGVPGRVVRPVSEKELAYITHAWSAYVAYARQYLAEKRKPYSSV
ncbi:MAG TPA: gamma carbonic anhydrase family protein [Nitrospiria bacterium]|nr:gamma carbonic anhydrase family protein [Nitrospiria bacterium]